MITHNVHTEGDTNDNGNLVIGYGNEKYTNIYGKKINLISNSEWDTSIGIEFYIEPSASQLVFRPMSNNVVNLGSVSKQWLSLYAYSIYENGTSLSSKYAPKSHGHSGESFNTLKVSNLYITDLGRIDSNLITLTTGMYLGSDTSYYINQNGTGKFAKLYANELYVNGNKVTSSRRFKENIVYADENTWHDKIMNVKPCTFNYVDETIDNKHIHIGVIAEDLHEVFPEVVSKNEDDLISYVNYDELVIPLILEVQRLNKIIDSQSSEISNLKSELSSMKSTINSILETINPQN